LLDIKARNETIAETLVSSGKRFLVLSP